MDAQSFTVEPYFIKFFRQRWYLIGHCYERNALRVYSLDRMDSATISDKSFTMKEKNYPQVLYNDNFGIIHGEENTKTHDILLKFTTKQGQYIQTRPLHHTQEVISLHIPGHTRSLSGSILRHKISLKSAILYPFIP